MCVCPPFFDFSMNHISECGSRRDRENIPQHASPHTYIPAHKHTNKNKQKPKHTNSPTVQAAETSSPCSGQLWSRKPQSKKWDEIIFSYHHHSLRPYYGSCYSICFNCGCTMYRYRRMNRQRVRACACVCVWTVPL